MTDSTCIRRGPANPIRDAEILRRWELGERSGLIAEALRITRNTVLGVVCRAGKQRRDSSNTAKREGGRRYAAAGRTNRAITMRAIKARQREQIAIQAQAIELEAAPPELAPIGERRTILTIAAGECRWPHGDPGEPDFHLCGGKTLSGVPYCGYHTRVAYVPRGSK